jgi:hypothetical protein
VHRRTFPRGRQLQLRVAQDLQFVSRHTRGIASFSNHMERMVVLDVLLRLAPCAWALLPTMVENDNPSSATTAMYATATDALIIRPFSRKRNPACFGRLLLCSHQDRACSSTSRRTVPLAL